MASEQREELLTWFLQLVNCKQSAKSNTQALFTAFVDLMKALDTVSREGLWKIMAKFGCPDRFISIIRQFHDGMKICLIDNGKVSKPFSVTNGVKQGSVLAITLFSMVFSAMLTDVFHNCHDGVNLCYCTDRGLFNLRHLQAKTKVKETKIKDFLFADDCALNACTEETMQRETNCFSRVCDNLTISIKKTEVMYQPAPGKLYKDPV